MKLPKSSRRSALSKGMAFAMSYLLLWGSIPAPALAEAVEELDGNEQSQAELVVQDDGSDALIIDGQPDLSNEEESKVTKLANQLREKLAEDATQEDVLAAAFHALADVVTVDDELTLEEGEAIDAALAGEATTTQGITDAFVALVEELGFTAELAHEEGGAPLAHVQLGDEWIEVNIALAVRDRVENGLDAAEDPWASKDETQDQEEATASQDEQTDEAAQPVEEERQSQEESDSVENQETEVESTDADGTENESAEAEEEEEEEVEYIYEEIDASNLTTFAATNVPLTAQADSSVAQTTSNVTTYAPYEYDSVRYSYLYVNEEGSLVRVEYSESEQTLYVQELDSSLLEPLTPKVIERSTYMPSTGSASTLQWGGFYKGASGFFVVTGLSNSAKNENTIVYRITKYDKNWTQKGAAEFMDNLAAVPSEHQGAAENGYIHYGTVVPFSESGVSMDEVGTTLHVRTAHQNFAGHQTNVHLVVNETNMSITGSMTYTANQGGTEYGYVSHSFAQRLAQYKGSLYALDLGDASPRALTVKLIGATGDSSYSNVLVIGGAKGVNYTGVTVGGFEASSAGLMSAYASIDQNAFTGKGDFSPRNVYVAVTPANPNPGTSTITKLTSYPDSGTTGGDLVKLVKISDNEFLVIWAEMKTDGDASWTDINQRGEVCYAFVNGSGTPTSSILRGHGYLSDCDPVLENGRVVWYAEDVYGNHAPVYYQIDLTTNELSSPQVKGNMQDIDDVVIKDQEYTGSEITPTLDVTLDGKTLVEGYAYELVYANNTNVSTDDVQASVTVRGIADNGYTSTKTFAFNIIKATPRIVPANDALALIVGGSSGKVTAKVYTSDTSTNTAAKSYGSVTYTSSNTAVATVTTGGVVKPVAKGECTIAITTTGNGNWNPAKTVYVPVEVKETKDKPELSAVPDSVSIAMGETGKVINATVTPGAGAVTFASADKTIVAVGSSSGVLTPKKVGSTAITVKCAESEAYEAATLSVPVTVTQGTPEITVPEQKALVVGGSTVSLGATFSPSSGLGAKSYTSSDTNVVAVSSTGVLTPKGAGTATVTVAVAESDNYLAAQAEVSVAVAKGAPTITVADKSLVVGDETSLSATTNPTALKSELTYTSSDEMVATVDEAGVITAVGAGTATITAHLPETANYGEASKEITVTVAQGTPTLVVNKTTVAMGDTGVVDAYFSKGEGTLTYKVDDEYYATVDAEGNVTPVHAGTTQVTVISAGNDNWQPATKTASIVVTKGTPIITAMEASVAAGGTSKVIAKLEPKGVGDLSYTSKNTTLVKVDEAGNLTGVKAGYTTINVAFAGNDDWKAVSEPVTVTVSEGTATVTATSALTIKLGETAQIEASVDPAEAGGLLYMVDDESIATVDESGLVTAVKPGTTKATVMCEATDDYASGIAEVAITVEKGTPTLTASADDVAMGTTGQVNVNGPEGVNSFSYMSGDTSVVEVDSTGKLTPKNVGEATITVTSGETDNWEQGTATVTAAVTKGDPTIAASDLTIPFGDSSEKVEASTTSGSTLTYASKNTSVVEVDATSGQLTPKATGSAEIEITSAANDNWNEATATITVTVVTATPAITASDVTVAMGKTANIGASVTKGAGELSYQSDNTNVVTVDANGKLTPVHVGTAKVTISCAANDHWEAATKDITVTVEKGTPTISAANVSLKMGEETKIEATASEDVGALSFTSQKESIAKVDSAGKITPVGVGTANVVVASESNSDWNAGTATVVVTVEQGTPTITADDISVAFGATASIGATTNGGTLSYQSGDESVVTVSTKGVLTPVKVGEATVTITSKATTAWKSVTKVVEVTVTPGAATIDADDVSVAMGTTKSIGATVEGNAQLTYASKNTAVATVDEDGTVTPVKVGTAKVEIKSAATDTHGAGSKTITVTVTKGTPTITANNVALTMGGGTATISATASAAEVTSYTYTSANTSIATVSSTGVVTPKAGGATKVTVTSKATTNWNASAPVEVTVTVNLGTPTITASNKSVTYGKTVSLGATTNGGTLSYKSSKESVATVSATGVVTPKAAGTTTITITSAATTSWKSVSTTVTVTVIKATPTVSASNKTVQMGKTVSIGATVSKGGGGISYVSDNEAIAKVDQVTGVVTPVSAGRVKITAMSAPTTGYYAASKEVWVTVTEGTPVITASNVTLVYGTEGKKVNAKATPGAGTLTFSSSKPAVVIVNATTGALTAVKAGTSYITITAAAVSGKWKSVSRRVSVKVTKATQTIKASAKDVSVKYDTAKQTVDSPFTASAPGNKLKFTRAAGSSKIKINKKTGELTIAKKTKRGKYTITAKITAAATPQYKKATKKVTFTVTVK